MTSQTNINSLVQKIQELKHCYYKGEFTNLDSLLYAVAIAGVKEAEEIYQSSREKEMDDEAKWIKENQMYQVINEE